VTALILILLAQQASPSTSISDGTVKTRKATVSASGALKVDPSGGSTSVTQGTSPWVTNQVSLAIAQGALLGSNTLVFSGCQALSGTPTYTSGTIQGCTMDVNGRLRVAVGTSALPTGAATSTNQTSGLQKTIIRSGTKGLKVPADITSTNLDDQTEALDIFVHGGVLTAVGNQAEGGSAPNPFGVGGLVTGHGQTPPNVAHDALVLWRGDPQGRQYISTNGALGWHCSVSFAKDEQQCLDSSSDIIIVTDIILSNFDARQTINVYYSTAGDCSTKTGQIIAKVKLADYATWSHSFKQDIRLSDGVRLCCDGENSTDYSCDLSGHYIPKP